MLLSTAALCLFLIAFLFIQTPPTYGGDLSFPSEGSFGHSGVREGREVVGHLAVGMSVVRGPDWQWGEQDGGRGNLGVIIEILAWRGPANLEKRTMREVLTTIFGPL